MARPVRLSTLLGSTQVVNWHSEGRFDIDKLVFKLGKHDRLCSWVTDVEGDPASFRDTTKFIQRQSSSSNTYPAAARWTGYGCCARFPALTKDSLRRSNFGQFD